MFDDINELSAEEQIGGWDSVESDDADYCWQHRYEPDRFQVKVYDRGREGGEMDYTDFNEIVYGLMGAENFDSSEAAFRYALDFMEQFEIQNWD